MNKSQLVDALADRLGDRRTASSAVDALLQIVVDTVRSGDSVSITGFGVFESRARAARTGRNPRTGEAVDVAATTVPAFRPGAGFRTAVAGEGPPTAISPGAPRRRPSGADTPGTNGAPAAASVALDGAVELSGADAAAVAASGDAPAKGKKGKAVKAAPKAAPKDRAAKDGKDGKDAKKGKKGKK